MVLPNPRAMCAVVDRMRATGSATKHLTLHADQRHREITLSIATSDVSIRTYFRGVLRDGEQAAGVAQPTQGSQDCECCAWCGGERKLLLSAEVAVACRVFRSVSCVPSKPVET